MPSIGKPRSTKGLAQFCARIADEKIAQDILILDMSKIDFAPTDFFVICSCDTDIQARAVADEIYSKCRELKLIRPRMEGYEAGQWVLLDFFDVVVHVMQSSVRDYYRLEKLWGDAVFYKLSSSGKLISSK